MGLSHGKAAYRVSVQVKFRDPFGVFDPDIVIDRSLVDAEQHLMRVDGIRQAVQLSHLLLAAHKPAVGPVDRCLYIFPVGF